LNRFGKRTWTIGVCVFDNNNFATTSANSFSAKLGRADRVSSDILHNSDHRTKKLTPSAPGKFGKHFDTHNSDKKTKILDNENIICICIGVAPATTCACGETRSPIVSL
jgi:hypothetical protein